MGAPLAETPQLIIAPRPAGYFLTIHQLWIDVDTATSSEADTMVPLLLMLPFAP